MNIAAESYGHTVMLHLKGELTDDTLGAVRQSVDHSLAAKDVIDLALDLENVTFVDSAALEYLLDLQDRLAGRLGQIKLIKPDDNIRKILEITHLSTAFEIFKDVPDAVKALQV